MTSHDGSIRVRCSRAPAASTTGSTVARGNTRANSPNEIRSARASSSLSTFCPGRPIDSNYTHGNPKLKVLDPTLPETTQVGADGVNKVSERNQRCAETQKPAAHEGGRPLCAGERAETNRRSATEGQELHHSRGRNRPNKRNG